MTVTGIILAGGKSSRMGKDKGLLLHNGITFVEHIINALAEVTSSIIIITSNEEYKKFGLKIYSDIYENKGPVGGIYSGLHYSDTEINIVVSCDTPFVTSEFFKWLLIQSKNDNITIPSYKGITHQLIGVYKKEVKNTFEKHLKANLLRLKEVNASLDLNIVGVQETIRDNAFDSSIFTNINTPEDLKKLKDES